MDTALKLALVLTAYDKASGIIDSMTNRANANFDKMHAAQKKMEEGFYLMAAGKKGFDMLKPAVEAYGELQEAGNDLRASMLRPGGVLDEGMYSKIMSMSGNLSDSYKGSSASYLDMTRVLKNNRIDETDILGGIGESTAKLADFLKMPAASIGEFAAHMKNDMGVAVGEMGGMMDLIARVANAGVGKNGSETVTEMNEFFSKTSLGLANLGVKGLEAGKQVGALGALFMSRGLSGATVGTNFRRIFDAMRDGDKLGSVIATAKQYGVALQFFDKDKKFMGIDNFVSQIGKLQDLDPEKTASVFKGFAGKQGLSTDFIEFLSKNGVKGYAEYIEKIKEQGTLDQKLQQIMGGLNYEQSVMDSSWTNLKATFGAALAPALTGFLNLLNALIVKTRYFLEAHPAVAKFATAFLAFASAALVMSGVIKAIQGVTAVMKLLNITMAMGPLGWIVGLAAGAALIYANWDELGPLFEDIFNGLKDMFMGFVNGVKFLFLNFTPLGLVIKYWTPITGMVMAILEKVKAVFYGFIDWVCGLGPRFVNVGKYIISGIWEGMKYDLGRLKDWFNENIGGLTHIFSFGHSNAIALPNVNAWQNVTKSFQQPTALMASNRSFGQVVNNRDYNVGNGGSSTVHFAPVIHLNGSATTKDADLLTSKMKQDILKVVQDENNRKLRTGY